MPDISTRLRSIVSEHAAARSAVGLTGTTTKRTNLAELAGGSRAAADLVNSRDAARSARRLTERERHDEAKRLARRLASIIQARDTEEDDERRNRLDLLAGDVESARDRYMHATWAAQATEEDWAPRGRLYAYARRFDLGFIGYAADDIIQDAAETLTATRDLALLLGRDVLPEGEPTATGSRTMSHTIGEAYRAIRHAYRRGLGFYGYERRGTVVVRDSMATRERDGELVITGYRTEESDTVTMLRWRGEDESAIRAHLMTADPDEDELDEDEIAALPLVERRRAALATLTRRFPLNADGRMLALAALLTEGYTIGELTSDDGLGLTETTLTRWADELGALVA